MTFALKLGPGFDRPPLCAQAAPLRAGRVAAAAAAVTAAAAASASVSTVGAAVAISVAAATGTAALTTAAPCHLRPH